MAVDKEQWKRWSPAAQEKAAEALRQAMESKWRPFYCPRPKCDGMEHGEWTWRHARSNQHPPGGDWLTWLNRGGRGSGKTRTGAEWTHRRTRVSARIALLAPTGTDARDIMVEGESGLLATAPPDGRPVYEPSKRRLTWPNGAKAFIFSGEEPDRLRGPQHFDAWVDEPAHIDLIEEAWSNLLFGLRLGEQPRICATTTPVPSKWMKELIKDATTVSVVASTYENLANLAPFFRDTVLNRYEGTRKGRQEIHGEVLHDVEGALWDSDMIEDSREALPDEFDRIVVAIDPAGSVRKKSDETGIVVVGAWAGEYWVMEDASGKYSPNGWAQRAVGLMDKWSADKLVVERNYGGDMVRTTLENADADAAIEEVWSRRGKVIRADPIVALYERKKAHHPPEANLGDLEDQLVSWVPGAESPDRLDALVHGMTALAKVIAPAEVASPATLLRNYAHSRNLRSVG